MKFEQIGEEGKLVIGLEGRIDSNNVNQVEGEINNIINKDNDITLDAQNLDYISSAGLRMILRIKKENDSTKVINCKPEVYDVFEMTGFNQMMEISKAYRELSINGCEKIGDGFYGTVYRMDPETIVKVYRKDGSLDMIKREKNLARKAFVMGIPTAIPYDIVKVGDQYGSVFELLNAKQVANLIKSDEEIEDFCKKSVDILKKMHSTKVNPNELPSRRDFMIGYLKDCKDYLSENVYQKYMTLLEDLPETNTMIHGDFHIKNIMQQNDELLLIDMDTLSTGHPIFELSSIYATYEGFSCVNKKNTDEFLGIPLEQSTKIWEDTFNDYFPNKTKEELEDIENKLKIISYLQIMHLRVKFNDPNNETQQKEIEFCKNYITDNIMKFDTLYFEC